MALPDKFIKLIGLLLFFAFFFESLIFIVYSSDVCTTFACSFSAGSGTGVAAIILALVSAAVVCKFPPYVDDFLPGTVQDTETPGTVTIKTVMEPDGTKKTITTTVNPDGSHTVEEVIEELVEKPAAAPY